jgi:hypothetical protein
MSQAADVQTLPYVESTSDAHMAASKAMLERADTLLAVQVVWPSGARRD